MPSQKRGRLAVLCRKSHSSNQRVLLLHTLCSPYSILPKNRRLAVFRSESPPSYSRDKKRQFPPKKEVTWVKADPSHIQAIQEAIYLNAPSKSSNLAVFRSKSPPSNSRDKKRQFPPKKEVTWVFSAASHLQAIREAININALPKKRKIGRSLPQVTFKQFERQ